MVTTLWGPKLPTQKPLTFNIFSGVAIGDEQLLDLAAEGHVQQMRRTAAAAAGDHAVHRRLARVPTCLCATGAAVVVHNGKAHARLRQKDEEEEGSRRTVGWSVRWEAGLSRQKNIFHVS